MVVDFRGRPIMKSFGFPVVIDFTPPAKAAIAVGADGIFIETLTDPLRTRSDGSKMLTCP